MGGSQSVEIPGGGTEGYHVLKVNMNDDDDDRRILITRFAHLRPSGTRALARKQGRPRGVL